MSNTQDDYNSEVHRAQGILLDAIKREAREGRILDFYPLLHRLLLTFSSLLDDLVNEPGINRETIKGMLGKCEQDFDALMKNVRKRHGYEE
jgi:hypothetical protein